MKKEYAEILAELGWSYREDNFMKEYVLDITLSNGIIFSFAVSQKDFYEDIWRFTNHFNKMQYVAELSCEYDDDVDMEGLIVECEEVENALYDLAYRLKWVTEEN